MVSGKDFQEVLACCCCNDSTFLDIDIGVYSIADAVVVVLAIVEAVDDMHFALSASWVVTVTTFCPPPPVTLAPKPTGQFMS